MLENEVTPLPDSRQTAPVAVEPDLEEARRQLSIFGDPNGAYTYQTICDATPKVGVPRILHGTLDEVSSELAQAQREGHGCYITVNPTDLAGRASENVTGVRFLVLDEDKEISQPFHKPPTMIVRSKAGRHIYWKLSPALVREDSWTKSRNPFTEAQERLNHFYGTDPTVKDLPRVLRLAGYYHQKKAPFMVRVLEANPEATYSLEELLEGIPALPVETLKTVAIAASVMSERQKFYTPFPMACRAELASKWLASDAPPAIQGEQGHSTLLKVCGKLLHGYLLDGDTAFELIKTVYNPRCMPPFSYDGDITHKLEDASKESFYNPDFYLKAPYERWLRENASSLGPLLMPSFTPVASPTAGGDVADNPADPWTDPATLLPIFKPLNVWTAEADPPLNWLVQDLLSSDTLSMMIGDPKAGKSTTARTLLQAVASGGFFLNRKCKQGKVIYLTGEGSERMEKEHYKKMTDQENIFFHFWAHDPKAFLSALEMNFQRGNRADLIILDVVGYFLPVDDFNAQAKVQKALKDLQNFAQKHNPHICLLNWSPKNKMGGGTKHGGIGSTAFRGITGTNLAIESLEKEDGSKSVTISTEQRDGIPIEKSFLRLDPVTEEVTLVGGVRDLKNASTISALHNHFIKYPDAQTADEVREAVGLKKADVIRGLNELREGGLLKTLRQPNSKGNMAQHFEASPALACLSDGQEN